MYLHNNSLDICLCICTYYVYLYMFHIGWWVLDTWVIALSDVLVLSGLFLVLERVHGLFKIDIVSWFLDRTAKDLDGFIVCSLIM